MRPATGALELALFLRPLVQGGMARRAAPRLAALALLLGICSILGAGVLLASLYAVYLALLQLPASPLHALLAAIAVAVVVMALCLLLMRREFHRLYAGSLPPIEKIAGAFDAFMEGFRGEKS